MTFTASCAVDAGAGGPLVNQAVATAPVDTVDAVAGNNVGSDTTVVLETGPCGSFNDRYLSDVVLAGDETIEACQSITSGSGVEVASDVTFRAPVIAILELVMTGGTFSAIDEAPTP